MIRCEHDQDDRCTLHNRICESPCNDYEHKPLTADELAKLADIIKATHTPDTTEETK